MKTGQHTLLGAILVMALLILLPLQVDAQRQMENLGRGVVAVRTGSGAFVSWRLLGLDPSGIGFNLYRSTAGGNWTRFR